MPDFGELAGSFGPVGAVLVWMWIADQKGKKEAPKEDASTAILHELRAISDRLIRIEAIVTRSGE